MKIVRPYSLKFRETTDNGLHMFFTCDQFPVQAEGGIDGDAFYFRARWGEWSIGIPSNPAHEAIDVHLGAAEGFLREGEYDDTETMTLDTAEALIRTSAEQYRAWKARAKTAVPS